MIDLIIKKNKNLKNDILSGLTVSLALVPEAIAFAFVAGVHPSVGLWAAFYVGLITSVIGGRPGMISGATGAMAVVLTAFVVLYGIEYLFASVILCGIIQILCGIFKLGKFIRLLPHPVMLGFVNGLAIVIGKAQFGQLKTNHKIYFDEASDRFLSSGTWLSGTNLWITFGLIALTMLIIHLLPKLTKAIPGTLMAIITVTLLVQFTPIKSVTVNDFVITQNKLAAEKKIKTENFNAILGNLKVSEVDQKGKEMAIAPILLKDYKEENTAGSFHIPGIEFSISSFIIILPMALTLAAIGLIESLMTLTLIDELTETRGHGNRECVGQGIANMVSGFCGSMGGCAMIGQSMINIRSGGRSRISGITAALFLLSFIIYPPLSACIGMIPIAALIGVMFIVVIATFEWTSLRLWNKIPKSDFIIIILVSSVTVLFDLAIAVTAGVLIAAVVFAWKKSQRIQAKTETTDNIKTYSLEGPLFFGATTSFKDIFTPDTDPEKVIIEFRNCRVYDHSAIEAINDVASKYKDVGKSITIKHLSKECQQLIEKASSIIESNLLEDPDYHIATNKLG
ncbi:MAG: sodium-independent anion transporter [Planctomycetota bacterium]|nr:MAG: sodium-independent anion transporter [Planctomycetota bacterium]